MGLEVGRQLALKGASIVIVARDSARLDRALRYISEGAAKAQRFHRISADLTEPAAAASVMSQVTEWNSGPPDVVWCCAGGPQPTLFVETELAQFRSSMDANYFSSLYMAHAAVRRWVCPEVNSPGHQDTAVTATASTKHLIFTSSFLALYPIGGHSAYSPGKVALRSLCDTLSQELKMYPSTPVRVHVILPATILGEAFDEEQRIKPDVTKMLEGPDEGQTAEVVARNAIRGLESGQELVATDLMTRFVMSGYLGASVRGGFWKGLVDWIIGCLALVVLVFVRQDMDRKVSNWGRRFGSKARHVE